MKIALIGGGNMGGALLAGLSKSKNHELFVLDPNEGKRERLQENFSVTGYASAGDWLRSVDVVILAVKPQVLQDCVRGVAPFLSNDVCLISIAAGVAVSAIERWSGVSTMIRVMPNTPALVGCGMTGIYIPKNAPENFKTIAETIFSAIGDFVFVPDEECLHTITAGSGSGPAYVFLMMEAMQNALIGQGLDADLAKSVALRTVEGAAALAKSSGESFSTLRENVTSKGGTTAAALNVFAEEHFSETVDRAMRACRARSEEMGKLFD